MNDVMDSKHNAGNKTLKRVDHKMIRDVGIMRRIMILKRLIMDVISMIVTR